MRRFIVLQDGYWKDQVGIFCAGQGDDILLVFVDGEKKWFGASEVRAV